MNLSKLLATQRSSALTVLARRRFAPRGMPGCRRPARQSFLSCRFSSIGLEMQASRDFDTGQVSPSSSGAPGWPVVGADRKGFKTSRGNLENLDPGHPGPGWTVLEPLDQRAHRSTVALDPHLDSSVSQIAHPANHPDPRRPLTSAPAKRYPLHPAADQRVPRGGV